MIRCTSTKSEDGGSGSPHVPCDGEIRADGEIIGGCGEPCDFIMGIRVPDTEIVLRYHRYWSTSREALSPQHLRVTVAIRRKDHEVVVWNHNSSSGPCGPKFILPAARDFATELAELLDAPITEIE